MTDTVRLLNSQGSALFEEYVIRVKAGTKEPIPTSLLLDPQTSAALPFQAQVDRQPFGRSFASAYEFGEYLCNVVFNGIPKSAISHNSGMWNWLALYFFDQLWKEERGQRDLFEVPAYVLSETFNYQRHYRHLVRSPWVLYSAHGQRSKVMLTTNTKSANPVAVRSELAMQIGATQGYVESPSVIGAVYDLYFDTVGGRLKTGYGGSGGGSPRDLVRVLEQFDLTYDLHASPASTIVDLLPKQFDKFTGKGRTRSRPTRQVPNLVSVQSAA